VLELRTSSQTPLTCSFGYVGGVLFVENLPKTTNGPMWAHWCSGGEENIARYENVSSMGRVFVSHWTVGMENTTNMPKWAHWWEGMSGRDGVQDTANVCKVYAEGTMENKMNCRKAGHQYLWSTVSHVGTGGDRRAWLQHRCCTPIDCQCPISGRQD